MARRKGRSGTKGKRIGPIEYADCGCSYTWHGPNAGYWRVSCCPRHQAEMDAESAAEPLHEKVLFGASMVLWPLAPIWNAIRTRRERKQRLASEGAEPNTKPPAP